MKGKIRLVEIPNGVLTLEERQMVRDHLRCNPDVTEVFIHQMQNFELGDVRPAIESLHLNGRYSNVDRWLTKSSSLRVLRLFGTTRNTEEWEKIFGAMRSHTSLQELVLFQCVAKNKSEIDTLSGTISCLPNLKKFTFRNKWSNHIDCRALVDALESLQNLEKINISIYTDVGIFIPLLNMDRYTELKLEGFGVEILKGFSQKISNRKSVYSLYRLAMNSYYESVDKWNEERFLKDKIPIDCWQDLISKEVCHKCTIRKIPPLLRSLLRSKEIRQIRNGLSRVELEIINPYYCSRCVN